MQEPTPPEKITIETVKSFTQSYNARERHQNMLQEHKDLKQTRREAHRHHRHYPKRPYCGNLF